MTVNRLTLTIIFQGISGRFRRILTRRVRSIRITLFIQPTGYYHESTIFVRRFDHSDHSMSIMAFSYRRVTQFRRFDLTLNNAKEGRCILLQSSVSSDSRNEGRYFIRIITSTTCFAYETRVCTRCEINLVRANR